MDINIDITIDIHFIYIIVYLGILNGLWSIYVLLLIKS